MPMNIPMILSDEYFQNNILKPEQTDYMSYAAYGLVGLLIIVFILLAFRDLFRLGTGITRIWALGRNALFEAWYSKLWAIPIIWFVICLILNVSIVRGYAAADEVRIRLSIFLGAQEVLVLLYMGIMACVTLPRERERKTIITTCSKPISRLELLLGKVVGLSAAAFCMLLIMMALTWAYMKTVDHRIKGDAAALYASQQKDYDSLIRHVPPSEGAQYVAQHGVLEAQNFITGTMRIAGLIRYNTDPPIRALKGGSSETLYLNFPSLPASPQLPPGFQFDFQIIRYSQNTTAPVKINVSLYSRLNPMHNENVTLTLDDQGRAAYVPKDPTQFFSYYDPQTGELFDPGPIYLMVTCNTFDTYLIVSDGLNSQQPSCYAVNLDTDRTPDHKDFMAPDPQPVITGFEAYNKQEIVGPDPNHQELPPEVASFAFGDLSQVHIPLDADGNFTVHMILGIDQQQGNEDKPSYVQVNAYDVDNPNAAVQQVAVVDENNITTVQFPSTLLSASNLVIDLRSTVAGHWLTMTQDSVQIMQTPSPFAVNLAKSELVIFMEVVLLITIAVAASTVLGWPVALLVTMVCYLLGNLFEFVTDLASTGGLNIVTAYDAQHLQGVWYYQIGSFISGVLVRMLNMLVHLMPDFTKYDPQQFIVESRDMPWMVLVSNMGWTLAFMLPALALGYLLLRKKELA
jgi:ABC-type transport system involved in multi-copper enzyme maturation permease subunit